MQEISVDLDINVASCMEMKLGYGMRPVPGTHVQV